MSDQAAAATRGARVNPVPPPLYYAIALVIGGLFNTVVPLSIGGRPATTAAGAVITVLGLALTAGGVIGVIRHRTTIVPHHAVATLITTGVYRLSRNPMYTGLGIAYLGVALLEGTWWSVLLWPLVMFAVYGLVIQHEERYLAERFGQEYADYRSRVRRWL